MYALPSTVYLRHEKSASGRHIQVQKEVWSGYWQEQMQQSACVVDKDDKNQTGDNYNTSKSIQ